MDNQTTAAELHKIRTRLKDARDQLEDSGWVESEKVAAYRTYKREIEALTRAILVLEPLRALGVRLIDGTEPGEAGENTY